MFSETHISAQRASWPFGSWVVVVGFVKLLAGAKKVLELLAGGAPSNHAAH